MWQRGWWQERIEAAWARRSVAWRMGVRRTGKTVLCQSLPDVECFDCERPSVRRVPEDPESSLARSDSRRVVLDEIRRLDRPAELLEIAADQFPGVKLIATDESDHQDLVDAYRAKDVLESFRLERRRSFQRLLELLLVQSGGIFA